jgi:hypothetical protein
MLIFKKSKLGRVAQQLAETIGSEAWQSGPRLAEKSEKVGETLKATKDGWRIWDATGCFLGFGIHLVDHYSRNYLDPSERAELVKKLVSQVKTDIDHSILALASERKAKLSGKDLRETEKRILQTVKYATDKFEQCQVIHLAALSDREEFAGQSSLGMMGILLTCAFIEDSDAPAQKLSDWESLDPKTLALHDSACEVAWNFHEKVKSILERQLTEAGFETIRDLGVSLRP